jgi:hypothetical protein
MTSMPIPWSKDLLEKLTVAHPVPNLLCKLKVYYHVHKIITWARRIQYSPSHHIFILPLSSRPRLGLHRILTPPDIPLKVCIHFSPPMCAACPVQHTLLHFIILSVFGKGYFLNSPVISYLLDQSALPNICSPLDVRNDVIAPYNILLLYILTL